MTRRKRIKYKWHFSFGDFDCKKATYYPNGHRTFEVWYKSVFVGICNMNCFGSTKEKYVTKFDIIDKDYFTNQAIIKGYILCKGRKNGFPTKMLEGILFPKQFNLVSTRKVLFEKWKLIELTYNGHLWVKTHD